MTITMKQLTEAAATAVRLNINSPKIRVPIMTEVAPDFSASSYGSYRDGPPQRIIQFDCRRVVIDGVNCTGIYYHDILMGVRV